MFNSKYKKNWSDITLKQFAKLKVINEREYDDDTDRLCDILSVVYACDINQVPLIEYNAMVNGLSFMSDDVPTKRPHSKYKIKDVEYEFCSNVADITVAQYQDFQSFAMADDIRGMVGCVLIPSGHKYNDGYDTEYLDSVDIVTARACVGFFVSCWTRFIELFQRYSIKSMKQMEKTMKKGKLTEKQRKEMERALEFYHLLSASVEKQTKALQTH